MTNTPSTTPKFTAAESAILFEKAFQAGEKAANAARSTPMVVQQIGANGDVVKQYEPVADGVCGFGWVVVRPGNSSFARWLKANTHAQKAYEGGISYWVRGYGQSYERKLAFARAFAGVLTEAGINAYGTGRLD